jgi:hypothetical protein
MEKEGWLVRDSGINTSSSFYRAVMPGADSGKHSIHVRYLYGLVH